MAMSFGISDFELRRHGCEVKQDRDVRSEYQRDRGRIVHSAAFRRLQGKTQVMGVGEGDFHRTRLTHSIEVAQIGAGILQVLAENKCIEGDARVWLPERDLIEAACFAHDLGHPPFGHGGERALQACMHEKGGFEGNGQTLRILCRLEKHREPGTGVNPTRRLLLSVLKYPVCYSEFELSEHAKKPPKCYFKDESADVNWAIEPFSKSDRDIFVSRNNGKACHKTSDAYLMELADDIAYGVHDLEDIVARGLADREQLVSGLEEIFAKLDPLTDARGALTAAHLGAELYSSSFSRKAIVSRLVNAFITRVELRKIEKFEHPLLQNVPALPQDVAALLKGLAALAYNLVISKPHIQQLETRGQRVVQKLYSALSENPMSLIPGFDKLKTSIDPRASDSRLVCDYIAGMTDSYAERTYRRLYIPGWGSSTDEL